MDGTMNSPLARSEDLVIEELGEELLVYDLKDDRAHSLGPVATQVFQACDGATPVDRIATQLDLDAETVSRAMDELATCQLLDTPMLSVTTKQPVGFTRRELNVKLAKVGAAAAALPLIVSVVAPTAAMAVSQATCAAISVTGHGCGECHKFGCCCCEPPGVTASSVTKPCFADCTSFPQCNNPPQSNCNGSTANCKVKGG